MLWLVCFFNYADRQTVFSVFPLISRQFSLTDVQLGVVGSSFMWMYALFGPVAGWLCDRFSRKTIVLGEHCSSGPSSPPPQHSRIATGSLSFAAPSGDWERHSTFPHPCRSSAITTADTRSRAMSIHQSSVYAGTIAGGAVAGAVGQYYGWRSPFMLFGILGALLALIVVGAASKKPERGMSDQLCKTIPPVGRVLAKPCPSGESSRSLKELLTKSNRRSSHHRLSSPQILLRWFSSPGCRPFSTRSST